jgi:hypothetical protein
VEYLHESGAGGAVVGSRGRFDVPRLRPGHYRLSVVSAYGAAQREVFVEPGARIEARFVLSQTASK